MGKRCGYKKGGIVMDGESDMSGPDLGGYGMGDMVEGGNKRSDVTGAGVYRGQKGLGAAHGHSEMNNAPLGHAPLSIAPRNGHKAM